MAYTSNILQIVLDGTGTEIPALNVTDAYDRYIISGAVTATGNYAIVPTGSPQLGTTYIFEYEATLDITTNGTTFSLFGVSFNQTQLISKLEITCYYNGTAWKVKIVGSLDQAVITTSSLSNNSITNAKLATMADQTMKANVSGGVASPSDIAISTIIGSNAWSLTGNSGTTAGTNFLGTTDAQDLVFKVNSVESGRISNSATSFGNSALLVNSGVSNTAVGYHALILNTNAINNTAIGSGCLEDNTVGEDNTAVGIGSGAGNITGNKNVFIGSATANSSSAENRIALGYNAIATSDYQFAIPDDVTTIKFKGIVYTLPTVNGAGVLTNDGSGVLTWV